MLIHEEIRDEVIERLKPTLSSYVKRFYNGRILGLIFHFDKVVPETKVKSNWLSGGVSKKKGGWL
ncbi:hypothetical protein [Haemophilus parainfluenzae]|jgi:hypothetical protein|uniref:hypothetical protein n=1 Tax=Haemophilus parainfluenzae TaxID=729 RepID=UPI001788DFC2|nr:hypothetical protein [Haemophilus parainfluenzae]MBS6187997.1 hypothetical protein [Haemophilus parainfluenzae]MDU6706868.1 hypothetical protein [Haemophilus parainfluenzae]